MDHDIDFSDRKPFLSLSATSSSSVGARGDVFASNQGRERIYLFKFRTLSLVANLFPALGVIGCVMIGVSFNYAEATHTHCEVSNALPSISALISMSPQKYVWKTCLAFHWWPRVMLMMFYYQANNLRDPSNWSIGVELIFLAELTFLMLLSIVTSNDHFTIHRNSFVAFLSCAILHMVVRLHHSRRLLLRNYTTLKLFKRKVITACVFYVAIILAGTFYYLHNKYCTEGMYTLFALSEYVVILCNLLFHNYVAADFCDHLVFMQAPELSYLPKM